jgi:hypothetical protein
MAALLDSLMQQLENRGAIDQIAGKLGVPADKANSAVSAGLPALLAGLAHNTQKPGGTEALATALDKDHDGSVLEDNTYISSYEEKNGAGILGHVFGEKTGAVQSQVAALGGIDPAQGGQLLQMLAPLVMGYLGKEKSSGGLDVGSLSKILGGGSGGGGLELPGGLGEILGQLGGGASTGSNKSSGLGGMLGKFLKKK